MELERLCKRVNNIPNSIERAYIKDITTIVEDILFEYDIFYKDTEQRVQKEIFLRRFLNIFGKQEEVKICRGISQNGNKCCRRVLDNTDYCKTHKYLEFREKSHQETKSDNVFVIEGSNIPKTLDTTNLQTRMVDGTFYYVDESFVYDKQTLERVGYIETDRCILTDDPFILCL
jgi:hypothetical protein